MTSSNLIFCFIFNSYLQSKFKLKTNFSMESRSRLASEKVAGATAVAMRQAPAAISAAGAMGGFGEDAAVVESVNTVAVAGDILIDKRETKSSTFRLSTRTVTHVAGFATALGVAMGVARSVTYIVRSKMWRKGHGCGNHAKRKGGKLGFFFW